MFRVWCEHSMRAIEMVKLSFGVRQAPEVLAQQLLEVGEALQLDEQRLQHLVEQQPR